MRPHQDTRIVQQHGGHTVHAQRCEVMFRDGSTVGLHPVSIDGAVQMFLRAVQVDGLQWVLFDVRDYGPEVEADIQALPPRDAHGVVFYTLRLAFHNAKAFHTSLNQHAKATWWAGATPALGPHLALS